MNDRIIQLNIKKYLDGRPVTWLSNQFDERDNPVNYMTVWKWVNNDNIPNLPNLKMLAEILEITIDDLIVEL